MEIVDLGKNPIPGAAAAGASARWEPEYEEILAEVAKLDSLHTDAGGVNWALVTEKSSAILAEKSKDLNIARYLCFGLLNSRGYAGLAQGLGVVADLLSEYWDGLFPPLANLRARRQSLIELAERGSLFVAARRPGASEAGALTACKQALQRIAEVAAQRFSDDPPTFADLDRAFREYVDAQEAAARKAEAAAKAAAAATSGAFNTVSEANDVLLRVASFLRQQNARDPLAFRLPRAVRWGALAQPPPAGPDGKTNVPVVPLQVRDPLVKLKDASNWSALLNQAESRFPEAVFWFDLQYYIDLAMGGLGADYLGARNAMHQELATLLERLPTVRELRFADGTPFADAATRGWLDREILRSTNASSGQGGGDEADFMEETRRLFGEGRIADALALAQQEMNALPGRERFLCRLQLSKLCLGGGKQRLAVRLLETLDKEVARFSLEEWDPSLSVEVVKLLYQCKRTGTAGRQPNPESLRSIDELYARLCRLDLGAALALDGS